MGIADRGRRAKSALCPRLLSLTASRSTLSRRRLSALDFRMLDKALSRMVPFSTDC